MFGDHAGWVEDFLRSTVSLLDHIVYGLMKYIYQIFFTISSSKIVSADMVNSIFTRIFMILFIFMLFKLSISFLAGIVNPDNVLGNEKKGIKSIIPRILTALVLLILVMPQNYDDSVVVDDGSWKSALAKDGILFGTLYYVQDVVLNQNVIGKIILAPNSQKVDTNSLSFDIESTADELGTTIFKTFFYPNEVTDNSGVYECSVGSDSANMAGWKQNWEQADTVEDLLAMLNQQCDN